MLFTAPKNSSSLLQAEQSAVKIQNTFRKHNSKKACVSFDNLNNVIKISHDLYLVPLCICHNPGKSGLISKVILENKVNDNFLPLLALKRQTKLSDSYKVLCSKMIFEHGSLSNYAIASNINKISDKETNCHYQATFNGIYSISNFNSSHYDLSHLNPYFIEQIKEHLAEVKIPSIYICEDSRCRGIATVVLRHHLISSKYAVSLIADYNSYSIKAHENAGFHFAGFVRERFDHRYTKLAMLVKDNPCLTSESTEQACSEQRKVVRFN